MLNHFNTGLWEGLKKALEILMEKPLQFSLSRNVHI